MKPHVRPVEKMSSTLAPKVKRALFRGAIQVPKEGAQANRTTSSQQRPALDMRGHIQVKKTQNRRRDINDARSLKSGARRNVRAGH